METLKEQVTKIHNANVAVRDADPGREFAQMLRDEMDAVWDAIATIADRIDSDAAKS